MNTYTPINHYQDSEAERESLNRLTQSIWGITVLQGGEQDYVPFSMQTGSDMVANICVGRFDLIIDGRSYPASMIQTVLTHADHRRLGLIRRLFKPVQQFIAETTGRTFFTANRDKQAFYHQFGYTSHKLIDYYTWTQTSDVIQATKMVPVDYEDEQQRQQFAQAAEQRTSVSDRFGFVHRPWLLLWFCHYFLHSHLWYCPESDVYLIYRLEDNRIDLLDIIGARIPTWASLSRVLPVCTGMEIRSYFVPDKLEVNAQPVASEEDLFFCDGAFPLPDEICIPESQRG